MVSYIREVLCFVFTRKATKMLFVLSVASLVLPWFTYNSKIMGYCFGSEFYVYFIAPMILVWFALFGKGHVLLGVFGAMSNMAVLVYALGGWMKIHNISSEFLLREGIHTSVSGFWISFALFGCLLASMITDILMMSRNAESEAMTCC